MLFMHAHAEVINFCTIGRALYTYNFFYCYTDMVDVESLQLKFRFRGNGTVLSSDNGEWIFEMSVINLLDIRVKKFEE